jgi:hypothetical protein
VPTESPRPPYLRAALAGVVVFVLYVLTLAPTTAFWDTSEYIAAARVLGIPHPPGNPLFTLLAHVFGLLPLAASYAVRINLFAAATSAAAAALWFLIADRWMRDIVPVRWARHAAAFAGALVGATSWTVWNQSTVNEKVYTVSLFSIALVLWLVVRWADGAPGARRDRLLVLAAYVLALTSTNHMMGVLVAPAVLIYVLWTDWRVFTRPWLVAAALGAVVVGVSINYIYLPIRAAQYPPINEGEPAGFFSKALMDVLNREQYGKPPVAERQADPASQLLNYLQYFSWQFARDWGGLRGLATAVFAFLGLSGLWALWKTERRAGLAALALFFTLVPLLIFYLNFKYGYSIHPEQTDLPREVRERDYFFVASFSAFGALVGVGFGAAMRSIAEFMRGRGDERTRWLAATPVLALALVPLLGNRVTASRAHETLARDFAYDILQSVEPYGILITAGDNDTFPLWYAQEVEGIRRDVTLANLSLMNTRWHLRQLRRRQTPEFEPSKSIALWGRDVADGTSSDSTPAWLRPTEPVLGFTEEELSSPSMFPDVMQAPQQRGMRFDSLTITFGSDVLQLQDLATIALIRQNLGKRPIFFSWSDGGYPDQTLGLTAYLVSQGLVRKLMPAPVVPNDSIVLSQGMGYMDLPRTRVLLWDVYHWKTAARERPRGWVDPPSASILQLYRIVYDAAGDTFGQHGMPELAARADSVANAVARNLIGRGGP